MKSALTTMLVALMTAVVAIMVLENDRIERENGVVADDTVYDYALAMSLWGGGNIISYNLHYTSEQCEYAKKFALQNGSMRAACVPLLKQPKPEDHH